MLYHTIKRVSGDQWRSHGGAGVDPRPLEENETLHLVTFIRILQNSHFIYPI